MTSNTPLKSIDAGYIPLNHDELFQSLITITDLLDQIDVPYVLTAGTLLGAIRENDLIKGDTDWDIEILSDHVPKILENRAEIEKHGLVVEYPCVQKTMSIESGVAPLAKSNRQIIKIIDKDGKAHGDFFVQTLFQDGILRRINVDDGAYFNAKMSFPYWFFENREKISLRDRMFWAPANPEMMIRRVFGDTWRTPFTRHSKIPGLNFAGAKTDANMEEGFLYALKQGWIPYYPDAHPWPVKINHTSTGVSHRWIKRHDHPELHDYEIDLEHLSPMDRALVMGQMYRILATFLKTKHAKQNKSKKLRIEGLETKIENHKKSIAKYKKSIAKYKKSDEKLRQIQSNIFFRIARKFLRLIKLR